MALASAEVVSPYFAYYHLPPIWVGHDSAPRDAQRCEVVLKEALTDGIHVSMTTEGLISFDASRSKMYPVVDFVSLAGEAKKGRQDVGELADARVTQYVELMNLHACCLHRAYATVHRVHVRASTGQSRGSFFSLHAPDQVPAPNPDHSSTHAAVKRCLDSSVEGRGAPERTTISIDCAKHALALLNSVLGAPLKGGPEFVAMLWRAARHYADHDFNSALITAWVVVERLLWEAWTHEVPVLAKACAAHPELETKRRQKLMSERDLTASIIVELLFAQGKLDVELYRQIETARRARNNLVHKADSVSAVDSGFALAAGGQLLRRVAGVDMSFPALVGMSYALLDKKALGK